MSKLHAAEEAIEDGNTRAARGQIRAFINHVGAQLAKGISILAGDALISDALAILALLPAELAAEPTPAVTPVEGTPTIPPPPVPFTPTPVASNSTEIRVVAGWNLISAPFALLDASVTSVFAGASAIVQVSIYSDGAWVTANRTESGWSGALAQIVDGKGYYVYATSATTLTLQPKPLDPLSLPPSYSLPAGWSMIGFTASAASMSVDTYLLSLKGKWVSLFRYDPGKGWQIARPGGGGMRKVEIGRGYWIYLSEAGTLVP
ncbi:MAG: hypothetical protein HYX92_03715 [Chloroflexi bacterium]|nr:hypothetical protein [Chloroflexota bacterium]